MNKILIVLLSLLATPLVMVGMEDQRTAQPQEVDLSCHDEEIDLLCHEESLEGPPPPLKRRLRMVVKKTVDSSADQTSRSGRTVDLFAHERFADLTDLFDDDEFAHNAQQARVLARNIGTRVAEMHRHLDNVVTKTAKLDIPNSAIILDIDDTCICSPESFKLLIQNPASPLFDEKAVGMPYCHYPIAPVLDLFTWAKEIGFKIFFLTARPEKNPLNPTQDVTHLHKQVLEDAHYGSIDNKQTFLICMPLEIRTEIMHPENEKIAPALIGTWKQAQHNHIERTHDCHIVAVLDDQAENINRKRTGQLRIPSPQFPYLTPQRGKSVSVGLGDPGILCSLAHVAADHSESTDSANA